MRLDPSSPSCSAELKAAEVSSTIPRQIHLDGCSHGLLSRERLRIRWCPTLLIQLNARRHGQRVHRCPQLVILSCQEMSQIAEVDAFAYFLPFSWQTTSMQSPATASPQLQDSPDCAHDCGGPYAQNLDTVRHAFQAAVQLSLEPLSG